MKALIVAAGKGERINVGGEIMPKPLFKVFGKYLIEHVIDNLTKGGITEFYIVVGFMKEKIQEALGDGSKYGVSITYIANEEYERANGISVYKGKPYLHEGFILSMCDHLFDPNVVKDFLAAEKKPGYCYLCTDRKIDEIFDLEDATLVLEKDGKIIDIHKQLTDFNTIDCGLFYLDPIFFEVLEQAQAKGDDSISGGVKMLAQQGKMLTFDIGDGKWMDIDTGEDLAEVNKRLKEFYAKS